MKPDDPQLLEDAVRAAIAAMPPATAEVLRRNPAAVRAMLEAVAPFLHPGETGVETLAPFPWPPLSAEEGLSSVEFEKRTVPYEPDEEVLSSREAAARIGLRSRQAVHDRLRKGAIVGWEAGKRGHVFPARQFDDRGRVIPGVCEIVKMLGDDAYGAWAWLTAPDAACGGEEPLALLIRGERDRVLASACGYWQGDFS